MSARRLASLLPKSCLELVVWGQPRLLGALAQSEAALDGNCRPSTSYSPAEPATSLAVRQYASRAQLSSSSVTQWRTAHTAACPQHGPACAHDHAHHQQPQQSGAASGAKPAPRRVLTLEEVEKACRGCDKLVKRGGLVCNGCATVQPPDESLSYFELFSL